MEAPARPHQSSRLLAGGIVVWMIVAAAVFLRFREEWFRAMADKAGFHALPAVDTLLGPALGLAGFAHLLLGGALLATSRWWSRRDEPATFKMRLAEPPAPAAGKTWGIALAIVILLALAARAPRMSLSFWGDESLCINGYVAGRLKPVSADDHQGAVRFIKMPWKTTFFADDGGGNNHFLYSILSRSLLEGWRACTDQPKGAFSEPLLRIWPLLAGLASLGAMAGLLRRLGLPGAGLLAAALLGMHPWHLRFSTEARGYTLMLFFFILALWSWVNALERGRWRDWACVAACQFFALWSWKGVLYPLLAVNAAFPVLTLLAHGGSRRTVLGRWFACNAVAAAVFVPLVAAAQIQMVQMLPRIARMGNLPADWDWTRNLLTETLMGCQAWLLDASNPEEVCLDRWAAVHPVLVPAALILVVASIASGMIAVARRSPMLGCLLAMIPVGGVMAAVHFKGVLHIELLRWYWFFLTPVVALFAAAGVVLWSVRPRRIAAGLGAAVLLCATAVLSLPMHRLIMTRATEDLRGALEIARGPGYRPWLDLKSSQVKTVWIWRHSRVYDPRGNTKVETVAQLQGYMRDADARGLEFCLISGYPSLTQLLHPEVVPLIENPACFEKIRTFWAQLPQNTLVVYRYRPGSMQLQTR